MTFCSSHHEWVCRAITGWENRWAQRNLVDEHPDGVSERAEANLAKAEAMNPEDDRSPDGLTLSRSTGQGGVGEDHARVGSIRYFWPVARLLYWAISSGFSAPASDTTFV